MRIICAAIAGILGTSAHTEINSSNIPYVVTDGKLTSEHPSRTNVLWTQYETYVYRENPSNSPISIPLVFYNRIPKTGSTSFTAELLSVARRSRGSRIIEYHPFWLDIGGQKMYALPTSNAGDRRVRDGYGAICKRLAALAERPYPGIWSFHVPWFNLQETCSEEWEPTEPGDGGTATLARLHPAALKDRELNAQKKGLRVWSDEIKWINQVRHPVDRWLSSQAFVQGCLCTPKHTPKKKRVTPKWCRDRAKKLSTFHGRYCKLSIEQLLQHALGIAVRVPTGGAPNATVAWIPAVAQDCYLAGWLLGDGNGNPASVAGVGRTDLEKLCADGARGLDKGATAELKAVLTQRFAWIGVLEESDASTRVLRHSLPNYFNSITSGAREVHTNDLSQRKHAKYVSQASKDMLAAALPIDMAIYGIVRDNLLAIDAEIQESQ